MESEDLKNSEEEKHKVKHILDVISDVAREVSTCPKEGCEVDECDQWDCNNCSDFENHFKFLCESVTCLCGILQNIILSNPELEMEDMRKDPLEDLVEPIEKNQTDSMYM